jgi:hypothetical protein
MSSTATASVRDRFIAVDDALLAAVVLPLLAQTSPPAGR